MVEFRTRRRVEFADTDMGGIMHFSRYFVFMETAEHLFLESLGTSVSLDVDGRKVSWPRVAATCEYKSPARFAEVIEIRVRIRRRGEKSITYEFDFTRDGDALASGRMTSVCCVIDPQSGIRSIPIPDSMAAKLGPAPVGGEGTGGA